jgi:hypothetical protein
MKKYVVEPVVDALIGLAKLSIGTFLIGMGILFVYMVIINIPSNMVPFICAAIGFCVMATIMTKVSSL